MVNTKLTLIFWVIVVLLAFDDCMGQTIEKLVWKGCGVSKFAFMHDCKKEYELFRNSDDYRKKNRLSTKIEFELAGGGATHGIRSVSTGNAHLGGSCRACLAKLGEEQEGLKQVVVAWDALAIVVNEALVRESKTEIKLTSSEVRKIFLGKITNWSQVGGPDLGIIPVVRRGKTSGVGYSFRQQFFGDVNIDFKAPNLIQLNSSGPVEQFVQRSKHAIAITGVSSAKKRKSSLAILPIDNESPQSQGPILSGAYKYVRPLYLMYKKGEESERFVKWVLSDHGQQVIERKGNTISLRQGAAMFSQYKYFEDLTKIENLSQLKKLSKKKSK